MNACGLTATELVAENHRFAGTAGVSSANRHMGFRPGFLDQDTGQVFLSRFADGCLAGFHIIEGLPPAFTERDASGRVRAATASIISGFVHNGQFYSREDAARLVELECQEA